MSCKLNHVVIYLKIFTNFVILGSFKNFKLDSSLYSKFIPFSALPTKQGYLFFTDELTKCVCVIVCQFSFATVFLCRFEKYGVVFLLSVV